MAEPDPAQVRQGSGRQVPPEGELDGARGDPGGGRDVGHRDVRVGLLVDERDRAAQRGGRAVAPVRDGRGGGRVTREGGQGHGRERRRWAGSSTRRPRTARIGGRPETCQQIQEKKLMYFISR
jgi:hypothetical protein